MAEVEFNPSSNTEQLVLSADILDIPVICEAVIRKHWRMSIGEAAQFMESFFRKNEACFIPLFIRTNKLPIKVGSNEAKERWEKDSCDAEYWKIIDGVFNSDWWAAHGDPNQQIIKGWATPYEVCILKSDAERFFGISDQIIEEVLHANMLAESYVSEYLEASTAQLPKPQESNIGAISNTHETPLMRIMQGAISEFFRPEREIDSKKDEVVTWIKAEMTKAGILDSNNIAEAMFTVIKPADHNPKKRRG